MSYIVRISVLLIRKVYIARRKLSVVRVHWWFMSANNHKVKDLKIKKTRTTVSLPTPFFKTVWNKLTREEKIYPSYSSWLVWGQSAQQWVLRALCEFPNNCRAVCPGPQVNPHPEWQELHAHHSAQPQVRLLNGPSSDHSLQQSQLKLQAARRPASRTSPSAFFAFSHQFQQMGSCPLPVLSLCNLLHSSKHHDGLPAFKARLQFLNVFSQTQEYLL